MEMENIFPLIKHLWQQLLQYPFVLYVTLLFLPFLLLLTSNNKHRSPHDGVFKLVPSPPRLPVIGNLHQLGRFPHRSLRALSNKYGPIMLLHLGQIPTIVISSADLVKEIVKKHDAIFSNRPSTTASDLLFYGRKNIVFSPYNKDWKQARRICALHLLSAKRVESFQLVMKEEVSALVDRIQKETATSVVGISMNLSQVLISTTNNIVSRCILGQKYEEQGSGSRLEELAKTIMVELMAFSFGDFFPCLEWIDRVSGFIGRLKSTSRELDAFYNQVIEEHRARMESEDPITNPIDFVDILLHLQKDPSSIDFELTNDRVKAILQDMLFAGIDTTSTVSEWLVAELLRNPRVMKKVHEEIRRVVGGKAMVDVEDINRMDYFKCVVKENLRLHLPGPLLVPRETSESVHIGGHHIPAKTRVLVNAWAIHMSPDLWERPEEFIPERFENNPVDFIRSKEYFHLIPFGLGRRRCPGMTLGFLIIEYMVANLLFRFDWKPRTGDDDHALPENLDMGEVFGITVFKKVPIHAVPKKYSP